jgi:DNA modification methylase
LLAGSNENDFVLDIFNGSGTTGYVAQKHNRKYIGIDIKQEYLDISINRLGLNKEGCLF